jgi:endonuclease-3
VRGRLSPGGHRQGVRAGPPDSRAGRLPRRRLAAADGALSRLFGDPPAPEPSDPLDTLVLTILSQNTSDRNRDRAWESLRARFPAWEDVLAAAPASVAAAIRVGGLANQKAARIRGLLRWARERFGAIDLAALRAMPEEEIRGLLSARPGIGPKTLSILLLFSLGREAFPVDTHCLRVLTRLGVLAEGTSAEGAHGILRGLVRPGRSLPLHLNLIRFGRERCHARRPECPGCPMARLCVFRLEKGSRNRFPRP